MSMHSHESHLAENKLRLYWDRVRDLPVKAKKGIEGIRYSPDTPEKVLAWVKSEVCRLRRVFESAKHGIPLKIKGDDVKLNFKPNVTYKRCPQPHWGYGAKRNIMTTWARKMLECGMFEHAPDSPWASRGLILHYKAN